MVRMKVKLLDAGSERTLYGDEHTLLADLYRMFPKETENARRLMEAVEAVNESGFAEIEAEPYRRPLEANLLPEGYDTQNQDDLPDPWPRG